MGSVTTEGLILKRRNFGEADRILTVLTDRFGKISIVARGVRKITSRRAGNIEILNNVKLHLFKSKSYTLTEAESIDTFSALKENLTLSTAAFHIIELVDRLTPEEQKNVMIYDLTLGVLRILEKNPRQIFIRAFEVKLLSVLGFWSMDAIKDLNPEVSALLEKLEYYSWEDISNIDVAPETSVAVERILRYYNERILESDLKSVKMLDRLQKK